MRKNRGMVWGMLLAAVLAAGCARAMSCGEVPVPILMYHNFAEEDGSYTVSAERFREHLTALGEAGYETVTFGMLSDWMEGTGTLPEKPVVLLSDDGYTGVLEYALPVLEEMDMVMSVAVIGDLMGVGGEGRLPHFSPEELAAADPEGRLEPVSHSFGLHGEQAGMRGAVNLTLAAAEYEAILLEDCGRMGAMAEMYPGVGQVFVYPYGAYSGDSEALLARAGYTVTVTTERGIAGLRQGESAVLLPRIPAEWYKTGLELVLELGDG